MLNQKKRDQFINFNIIKYIIISLPIFNELRVGYQISLNMNLKINLQTSKKKGLQKLNKLTLILQLFLSMGVSIRAALLKSLEDTQLFLTKKFNFMKISSYQSKVESIKEYVKNQIKTALESQILQGQSYNEFVKKSKIYASIFGSESKLLNKFMQIILPNSENIEGDFDILIDGLYEYDSIHRRIIESINKNMKQKQASLWILQNFLDIDIEKKTKVRSVFEIKRNIVSELENSEEAKAYNQYRSKIKNEKLSQQNIHMIETQQILEKHNSKKSSGRAAREQRKELKKKKKEQKKAELKEIKQLFEQYAKQLSPSQEIVNYLKNSQFFSILSQLMKISIATHFYSTNQEYLHKCAYRHFSDFEGTKKLEIPPTVVYLVVNNNVPIQQARKLFSLFYPVLKCWFEKTNSCLHIVGYSKLGKKMISHFDYLSANIQRLTKENLNLTQQMQKLKIKMKEMEEKMKQMK